MSTLISPYYSTDVYGRVVGLDDNTLPGAPDSNNTGSSPSNSIAAPQALGFNPFGSGSLPLWAWILIIGGATVLILNSGDRQ